MAIGSSENYRMSIEQHPEGFMRDEVTLQIVKKAPDGVYPITLTFKVGEFISYDEGVSLVDVIPVNTFSRELAELMLSSFGRYFLSADGDLVTATRNLRSQLERVTKQLESLIAGIGRLGGVK